MQPYSIEMEPPASGECCDWRELSAQMRDIRGPKELILRPGTYCFDGPGCVRWSQAATNSLEAGCDPTRPVALYLRDIDDLTIRGNGALLLMLDDLTAIGVDRCRNLTLENLRIDYRRPRVSELRVDAVTDREMRVTVHPDSPYHLEEGRLLWDDTPYAVADLFQILDGVTGANQRTLWNPQQEAVRVTEIAPGRLRFHLTGGEIPVKPGDVLLCRTVVRDRGTALFHESSDLCLDRIQCHASTGLGFAFQMCRDIAVTAMRFAPEPARGRCNSAFADHLHFSGCRGRIDVSDCELSAGQDDPINVHGTYLGITAAASERLETRFMHIQTWGFNPFAAGDEVALVDPDSLARLAVNRVQSSTLTTPVTVAVRLERPWPPEFDVEGKVLENLSAYPEVCIRRCRFSSYPTRGILLSSAKPSLIEECDFEQKAPFAAILIAGDARSWYESGGIGEITIRRNRFFDCPVPAIEINPEADPVSPIWVHMVVKIHDNEFHRCRPPLVTAHHLASLQQSGNRIMDD